MGQAKQFKKQRKYAKKEAMRIYEQFAEQFNLDDFIKSCPKLIPQWFWNFLTWLIVKHK